MFWVVVVVVALWMPQAQGASDQEHARIVFLHSLGVCISGPVTGRTIEVKSPLGEVIGRIEYEMYGNAAVCEPTGSIECLEVDTRFRRHGIGMCLFQTALDDMRNQGCKNVSWQSTEGAVPFYTKLGALYMYAERLPDSPESIHGMRIPITEELALPASRLPLILSQTDG